MSRFLVNCLVVAAGGAIGSTCRYGLSLGLGALCPGFPLGTLVANVLGSLVIGFVTELAASRSGLGPEARLFFATGFCGGLTTLSSFLYESNALAMDRQFFLAGANALLTLAVSFLALWAGILACRLLLARGA